MKAGLSGTLITFIILTDLQEQQKKKKKKIDWKICIIADETIQNAVSLTRTGSYRTVGAREHLALCRQHHDPISRQKTSET
jgi:hypothetical protein